MSIFLLFCEIATYVLRLSERYMGAQVTVAVLEKGLTEAEVEVNVLPRRLTVRRKQDMALLFDKVLYEEVLPEKKKTRFMASKVRRRVVA